MYVQLLSRETLAEITFRDRKDLQIVGNHHFCNAHATEYKWLSENPTAIPIGFNLVGCEFLNYLPIGLSSISNPQSYQGVLL